MLSIKFEDFILRKMDENRVENLWETCENRTHCQIGVISLSLFVSQVTPSFRPNFECALELHSFIHLFIHSFNHFLLLLEFSKIYKFDILWLILVRRQWNSYQNDQHEQCPLFSVVHILIYGSEKSSFLGLGRGVFLITSLGERRQ